MYSNLSVFSLVASAFESYKGQLHSASVSSVSIFIF